jgi:hypothetical protein
MKTLSVLTVAALSLLVAKSSFAALPLDPIENVVEITSVGAGGGGCAADSQVSVFISEQTLSLSMPDMNVSNSSSRDILQSRKSCALAVGLNIKPGYRIKVSAAAFFVEARGDRKAQAVAKTEIFQAGGRGPVVQTAIPLNRGPGVVKQKTKFVTQCGGSLLLRTNSSVQIRNASQESVASFDKIKLLLSVEKCR